MNKRLVHCVIYSHIWSLFNLDKLAALGPLDNAVVVELAINSNLSASFMDAMKNRLGLGGLLRHNLGLQDIAESVDGVALPVAFAPRPPIPVGALASAVGLLGTAKGNFDKVILMVNCMEAPQLSPAFVNADRFYVLWDLADAPTRALAQVGDALVSQRLISPDNWGGFHLYTHPKRPVENAADTAAQFQLILGQYPALDSVLAAA